MRMIDSRLRGRNIKQVPIVLRLFGICNEASRLVFLSTGRDTIAADSRQIQVSQRLEALIIDVRPSPYRIRSDILR